MTESERRIDDAVRSGGGDTTDNTYDHSNTPYCTYWCIYIYIYIYTE